MELQLKAADLKLAEQLLENLRESNRLDGYFSVQNGGAYGAIEAALVTTLTCGIMRSNLEPIYWDDAKQNIARRLHDEAIDNGESIAYQVALLNEGIIEPYNKY